MRRLWTIFLVAILAVNSFPLAAQAHLVCRMTDEVMKPVAVEAQPRSCCAVRRSASGGVELANRSCCDLKTTPGHEPISSVAAPETALGVAIPPTVRIVVPVPPVVEAPPSASHYGVPRYRGPPLSSVSPRGPPALS